MTSPSRVSTPFGGTTQLLPPSLVAPPVGPILPVSRGPVAPPHEGPCMRTWLGNVLLAIKTVGEGLYVTLWYFFQTYKRRAYTQQFEYPERPVPVKARYRGF